MSDARSRPFRPVKPGPAPSWQRVEAGRYRSSDDRFMLESDGGGRWFIRDQAEPDDLGLARMTGPFATLAAAKAAAETARGRPAAASPLAARLADAASRPGRAEAAGRTPDRAAQRGTPPEVTRPRPTWLDDLADRDPEAARRARRLVRALAETGITDADALVRRDVLGGEPAIARRLLARAVMTAVANVDEPTTAALLEAVLGAAASGRADVLPGWELVEREAAGLGSRSLRLTAEDLGRAAEDLGRAGTDG